MGRAILAVGLMISVSAAPVAAADMVFKYANFSVPVGANPQSVDVADCNGDGLPDLTATGFDSDNVVVFHNSPENALYIAHSFATRPRPGGSGCGDFNRDGVTDVAVASWEENTLTVYRGQPGGGVTETAVYPVGTNPIAVAAGDVNADHAIDLVVVNAHSSDITILFGNNLGAFPASSTIRLPSIDQMNRPLGAQLSDFNLDGYTDIVVVSQGQPSIRVLLGDGNGFHFSTAAIPSPENAKAVAAGDFNNDGLADLAIAQANARVTIYDGTAAGAFLADHSFLIRQNPTGMAAADFNQDGLTDIVITYSDIDAAEIVRATAPGVFEVPGAISIDEEPSETPLSAVVNHFGPGAMTSSGDGASQLVYIDRSTRALNLVQAVGLGTLSIAPLMTVVDQPDAVMLADMNNDGIRDAIVAAKIGRTYGLRILPGNGNGGFDPPTTTPGICGNGVAEGAELCDDGNAKSRDGCSKTCSPEIKKTIIAGGAADLNGDGNLDLVVADDRGTLLALFGDGAGRFSRVLRLPDVKAKTPVALGDFNNDSFTDIALVGKSSNTGLAVMANDGFGNFATVRSGATGRFIGPVLAGDFDGNGFLDLAVGNKSRPIGFTLVFNDGAGPSRTAPPTVTAKGLQSLAAADFNEDGQLDILAEFGTKQPPTLYTGSTSGQFTLRSGVGTSALPNSVIADLNGDLHHDIVSCGAGTSPLCRVLYGDGSGAFAGTPTGGTPEEEEEIGTDVFGAGAADFDGDGFMDLVGISREDNRSRVIFRHTNRANASDLELPSGNKPSALAVADLNNDGRADVVVVNEGSRDISVYTNAGNRQFNTNATIKLPQSSAGPGAAYGPPALDLADINGDGRIDLAVSSAGSWTVSLFLNTGAGFGAAGHFATGAEPRGVTLANLNGDGVLDVVTANRSADTISVFLSQPEGGYARTDFGSRGKQPADVAAADLDEDGLDDLIVINELSDIGSIIGNVVTLLNDGTGNFGNPPAEVIIRGSKTPVDVCVGDFNGDHAADVAVGSVVSGEIMLLHGAGDGRWNGDERAFPAGFFVRSVDCFDGNNDGRTDIAFSRRIAGDVGAIVSSGN